MTMATRALLSWTEERPRRAAQRALSEPLGSIDRYIGAMLGVGIGDALGRPGESKPPRWIARRYGSLTDYHRWHGWRRGPIGTITDDTQMTMCIAESLVARGAFAPDDIAARFVAWLPSGRGKGRTCVAAVERLQAGHTWRTSGVESAGNGAAMRVTPVGLYRALDASALRREAAASALITHRHPMAVVSAIAQAGAAAYLTRQAPSTVTADGLLRFTRQLVGDLPDPGAPERREGASGQRVRLGDRLAELGDMLDLRPADAMSRLNNGAYVLESLPAAWWFVLTNLQDPERGLVGAANAGYDSDTVASMAGALFGALHGAVGFPSRWIDGLEYRAELERLGRDLHALAGSTPAARASGSATWSLAEEGR